MYKSKQHIIIFHRSTKSLNLAEHTKRKNKEFKLIELSAKDDKNREAKSGETLYLVNTPSITKTIKTVKYNLKIAPKLDLTLIYPSSIKWSYDDENQYFSTAKTNVTRRLKESKNIITTSVIAGSPNALEKSVDVKWVDEGFTKPKLWQDMRIKDYETLKVISNNKGLSTGADFESFRKTILITK